MKKVYDKNELNFALIWIGIYVVLVSIGDNVSASIGITKLVTAPICVVLTVVMYLWIRKYGFRSRGCYLDGNQHGNRCVYRRKILQISA